MSFDLRFHNALNCLRNTINDLSASVTVSVNDNYNNNNNNDINSISHQLFVITTPRQITAYSNLEEYCLYRQDLAFYFIKSIIKLKIVKEVQLLCNELW